MMPRPEDFIGRNPYKVEAKIKGGPSRPEDNPAIGGEKTFTLPDIKPFIATVLSDVSPEELRISIEKQFRELQNVSESILVALDKAPSLMEIVVSAREERLLKEIELLKERLIRLERGDEKIIEDTPFK